jgi:hypothetical protein
VATFPNVLVVNAALPVKSVQELVTYAKANPGKLSYASQGNAASGHLVGEQFKQHASIEAVHVPYRGAAPALQDLVAGHVQMMFDSVAAQMPLIRTARLALACSRRRIEALPDVPTMTEAGFGRDAERHLVQCSRPPARRARRSTGSAARRAKRSRSRACAGATSSRAPCCLSARPRTSLRTSRPSGRNGAR